MTKADDFLSILTEDFERHAAKVWGDYRRHWIEAYNHAIQEAPMEDPRKSAVTSAGTHNQGGTPDLVVRDETGHWQKDEVREGPEGGPYPEVPLAPPAPNRAERRAAEKRRKGAVRRTEKRLRHEMSLRATSTPEEIRAAEKLAAQIMSEERERG